jgi:hypothetical protein
MAQRQLQDAVSNRFFSPDIAFVDVEFVIGGGTDDDSNVTDPVSTPFYLISSRVDSEWGMAVVRLGYRLR